MGSEREELFKKKQREKSRRQEKVKDRAPFTYLIICEGKKTEPNYFKGIANKINNRYSDRINIKEKIYLEVKGTGRNTNDLVNYGEFLCEVDRFINEGVMPYGHVWVIFDKDDFSDNQFNSAIQQATSKGYHVGWSNEAIELWFLLHFEFLNTGVSRQQYCDKLSEYFKFHSVDKEGYKKNREDIFNILYEYGGINQAIKWGKKLLDKHMEMGITTEAKMNPATTVFKLVEELKEYF